MINHFINHSIRLNLSFGAIHKAQIYIKYLNSLLPLRGQMGQILGTGD